jgi:hypothetical protein
MYPMEEEGKEMALSCFVVPDGICVQFCPKQLGERKNRKLVIVNIDIFIMLAHAKF